MTRVPGNLDVRKVVMLISLAASALMLGGKLTAYFMTGSVAIFSDACESLVHGAATSLAALSLWYADQPADSQHAYGHGKIVYFSAGFEGALILAAAVAVVGASIRSLILGSPSLRRISWGLAITAVLAAFNLILGLVLVSVGKRQRALVLVANGKHVLADMWTSLGAVVGLSLVWLTGLRWIDPVAGLLIGGQIGYTAASLLRQAYDGLMDRTDPERTQALVAVLNEAIRKHNLVGFHQLRHRASNDQVWVEVHLLVPSDMTAEQAHRIATEIEGQMRDVLCDHRVWITSHIEPGEHGAAHPDGHDGPDPLL